MARRRTAEEIYWEISDEVRKALDAGLRSVKSKRLPRDQAEAERMMRDPFETFEALHKKLTPALRRIGDGQRRVATRKPASDWRGSNQSLIDALKAYDVDLVLGTSSLTLKRLAGVLRWLNAHHPDRAYGVTIPALRKAIQRARSRPPYKK